MPSAAGAVGPPAPNECEIDVLKTVISENNDCEALRQAILAIDALPHKELLQHFVTHAESRLRLMPSTPVCPR